MHIEVGVYACLDIAVGFGIARDFLFGRNVRNQRGCLFFQL